jgi:hypothetical protein
MEMKICPKCGHTHFAATTCPYCGEKVTRSPEDATKIPVSDTPPNNVNQVKFCSECGNPINDPNAQFCPKCGVALPRTASTNEPLPVKKAQQQGPTIVVPIKNRSTGEWIAISFGGLILLFIIILFISNGNTFIREGAPAVTVAPTLSVVDIKSQAQSIPWSSLMRNSNDYTNSLIYFRGKIVQVENIYGGKYYLRIDTKQDPYIGYDDDTIWVDYTGNRFLEGDIIDVWGNFVGLKSYTAVLGNDITIPEINALHVEMVKAYTSSSSDSSSITYEVTTATPTLTQNGWVYDPNTGSYKKV